MRLNVSGSHLISLLSRILLSTIAHDVAQKTVLLFFLFEAFDLFVYFMAHKGHHNLFIVFQVVFDKLVEF